MNIKDLINKKIAILGFGLEGKSTLKFLKEIGVKDISILDKKGPHPNPLLKGEGIKSIYGDNYLDNLDSFDLIFKTPGISPYNNSDLLKYSDKIISQAQIFFDNYEGKVIGITGTKGKSTVSTLTYEILKELGYNVKLVGNIGNPVFDEVDLLGGDSYDFIVYELSSYMLEGLNPNLFIGLVNNVYDCHLDWHDGRDNYERAKYNVLKNSENKLVSYELENSVKFDDVDFFGLSGKYIYKSPHPNPLLKGEGIRSFYIGNRKIIEDENIALRGEHNRKNIAGILGILDKIGIIEKLLTEGFSPLKKVLSSFTGLAHRQENIGIFKGITFINDSIASTPESAIAAIKTFGENIGTVFIGNEDSGFDLAELKNTVKEYKIQNIVLFPTTGEKLFGDFSKNMDFDNEYIYNGFGDDYNPVLYKTLSMDNAVQFAYKNTKKGQVVLLSTGAPSFNADGPGVMPWKSYVEKGNMFKKGVEKYSK